MEITELLTHALNSGASDLHLSAQHPPIMRVHGDMVPLRVPPLTSEEVTQLLYSIMTEKQRSDYEEHFEIDFAVHLGEKSRFRVNAYNTLKGPAAALRSIPVEIKTLEQLKTPPIIGKIAGLHSGMILVTGPTGSGKTTTMAAMIDYINKTYHKHILTIEDPVEFVHKSQNSLVNQREIGVHSVSFARALKSALREDPDIIMVGEMRDLETIRLAMTAAETGHLVFGTLHTNSAAKTVDRIIDVFPAEDKAMIRTMLSSSLEAVISQRLVKTKDGKGRRAVHEILICNPAVRNLIREGKIPQIYSVMQVSSKVGMVTMKDSVMELVNKGDITSEAARGLLNMAEEDPNTAGKTGPGGKPAGF